MNRPNIKLIITFCSILHYRDSTASVSASLAQWLEHWSCKPGVESSSLSRGCRQFFFLSLLIAKLIFFFFRWFIHRLFVDFSVSLFVHWLIQRAIRFIYLVKLPFYSCWKANFFFAFIYSSIVRSFSSQFVRSSIYSASNSLFSSCLWVRLAFAQVFKFIISLLCVWRVQECFLFKRNAFKFLTHVQSKTSQLKTVGKTLARFNTQFEKGVFHFFAMKVKNTLR